MNQNRCIILAAGKSETQRRPALYGGLLSPGGACFAMTEAKRRKPPDERKEGDANELRYISGSNPDWYIHCRSRRIVLYNLREKKIAAHYSH